MIIDKLESAGRYEGISPLLARAFEVLRSGELEGLAPGRHEIAGDDLFAMVNDYDPSNTRDGLYEAHKRYIDVQYYVTGGEQVGYAPLDTVTEAVPYSEERDIAQYHGDGAMLTLRPGMFFVAFPEDAHLPGVADGAGHTVKIVVKVRV